MPHVVTDHCLACRYTECVTLCPVDCFHGDGERLYIDPEACINCAACVPVCPVQAISDAFDLGDEAAALIAVNRERSAQLPVIAEKADALPTAEARRAALGFG
jgi:ferredoxin